MGLLDKAEKKKRPAGVSKDGIKDHIEEKISLQESGDVDKPTVIINDNKIQVLRPEGTLEGLKGQEDQNGASHKYMAGDVDFRKIKAEIEAEVRGDFGRRSPGAVIKDRVATGIPGLDDVMGGGLRSNSVNLVAGGAGSGKTILGMQFLVNGIESYGQSGIYISFEQTEKEILEDMKGFDWQLDNKIKDKKLVILTYTPDQVENVLRVGGGTVRDTIESINAKRVVIDSLSAFTLLHEDALAQRKACIELFESIKKWSCTALLLSEQDENPDTHRSTVEEFEVDSVILLYNLRKGDSRERALEIFKMRGSKHSAKIFPMTISDTGIRTFPDQTVF